MIILGLQLHYFYLCHSCVEGYRCHLRHRYQDKYTAVRTFASIMSYYMLNNNLNGLFYEYVKSTIIFIIVLILGCRRSNEANHSPDTDSFTVDSEVLGLPEYCYCSDLSSLPGERYRIIRIIFLF